VGLSRLENGGRARNGLLRPWHCRPDPKCAIRQPPVASLAVWPRPGPDRRVGWERGGHLVALLGTADGSAGFDEVGGFQGTSSDV
jgi:hypothetical protein